MTAENSPNNRVGSVNMRASDPIRLETPCTMRKALSFTSIGRNELLGEAVNECPDMAEEGAAINCVRFN